MDAGEGRSLIRVGGYDVGVSICYEAAFSREISEALPEAAYLVNVSNDSWFGDSVAPHQHLQIARLRASENGRPLVRATSTGISAVISHRGRVLERSTQFAEQVLSASIRPRHGATPYVLGGGWVVLAASLALSVAAAVRILHRMRLRRSKTCTATKYCLFDIVP